MTLLLDYAIYRCSSRASRSNIDRHDALEHRYCKMSNAQGMTENFGAGWTLAMKMDGADTTNFKYDSALWTNDKGLHENSANMQRKIIPPNEDT